MLLPSINKSDYDDDDDDDDDDDVDCQSAQSTPCKILQKAKFPEKSHFFNLHNNSIGRHVNAASPKSLEIQAYSITKVRALLK